MKYCLAFLFGFALAHAAEAAKPQCRAFTAQVQVDFTSENCSSPVGLCTKGKIWGDPFLTGTTGYTVEKVAGSAEDPTMAASLVYSGTMKIATKHGEIVITDLGTLDKSTGLNSSQSRKISGKGTFGSYSGVFFTAGAATATGFKSSAFGQICIDKSAPSYLN